MRNNEAPSRTTQAQERVFFHFSDETFHLSICVLEVALQCVLGVRVAFA